MLVPRKVRLPLQGPEPGISKGRHVFRAITLVLHSLILWVTSLIILGLEIVTIRQFLCSGTEKFANIQSNPAN